MKRDRDINKMPMDFENLKNERSEKLENNKKDVEISTKCQWILKILKIKEVKNQKTIKKIQRYQQNANGF